MKLCTDCNGTGTNQSSSAGILCKTCEGMGWVKSYGINMKEAQMNTKIPPHGTPHGKFSTSIGGSNIWEMCDAIVLCSGGMDSVTLAHYVKKTIGMSPALLFFNYGQKTLIREWAYAMMCSNDIVAPLTRIDMSDFPKFVRSAIVEGGERSDVTQDTVVPGRNLLFTSYAVALADSANIESVYIGVQMGDNEGYPDCRPDFWSHVTKSTQLAYGVNVYTPFITWSKKDIVKIGNELEVDYSNTWSCYYNIDKPCGECPSCKVRKEAGV